MAPLLRSDGAFFARKWGFLGLFWWKYHRCGMRNAPSLGLWECRNRRTFAVANKLQLRAQAAPRQFEYIRLRSACTELAVANKA
jgi:hypothetical protein